MLRGYESALGLGPQHPEVLRVTGKIALCEGAAGGWGAGTSGRASGTNGVGNGATAIDGAGGAPAGAGGAYASSRTSILIPSPPPLPTPPALPIPIPPPTQPSMIVFPLHVPPAALLTVQQHGVSSPC